LILTTSGALELNFDLAASGALELGQTIFIAPVGHPSFCHGSIIFYNPKEQVTVYSSQNKPIMADLTKLI